MTRKINKKAYADMYGPTVGDKVRLADTDLIIEIVLLSLLISKLPSFIKYSPGIILSNRVMNCY